MAMDGGATAPSAAAALGRAISTAHAPVAEAERVLTELKAQGGATGFALVALFVSPEGDAPAIAAAARAAFPACPVIGCTTAGEISSEGYAEGEVVGLGFSAAFFAARAALIPDLRALDPARVGELAVRLRADLAASRPDWTWEFAWLLNDGLARSEDILVSALRYGLGSAPLFGGSAGDGLDFRGTAVLIDGAAHDNAAVLAVLRSRGPIKVFKFDHFVPTATKMVVTRADPEKRVVHEINAEPAAFEYARLVGKDPSQLSPFIFAAHPVVVTVGGQHHVRAIQKVEPNGDITFFSAIDEGLVLTLAEPSDIVRHLDGALDTLARAGRPAAIIGCDCILRRLEVEERQKSREMSAVLSRHGVVGFNTYGEQFNSVHVNQTFTGVAIYPPDPERERP
jgi:hypothetical protein